MLGKWAIYTNHISLIIDIIIDIIIDTMENIYKYI